MDNNTLWSLRLGYNAKNAGTISRLGMRKFLEQSFDAKFDNTLPDFLADSPKKIAEIDAYNKANRALTSDERAEVLKGDKYRLALLRAWWIDKMVKSPLPLREKMMCMLHNHFVATAGKIKVNYWVYSHNAILRKGAFGNLKELTKKIVKSNAVLSYLDNNANKKNKVNENLSRELLELFTLGIGNYKEADIVNGAKALAGLGYGDDGGEYDKRFESNETITYLGRTGKFKADDLIDIIFEQKAAPYLFTRKVLSWFIYDTPPEDLVKYYGDYLRQQNFEIKPLLIKIFTEEFSKDTAGSKIKDPLLFTLQLIDELGLEKPNPLLVSSFIDSQGMNLYGQANVKGWKGGYSWLSSQVYLRRNMMADRLCKGHNFPVTILKNYKGHIEEYTNEDKFKVGLTWDAKATGNKVVIAGMKDKLLFAVDDELQKNFETVLTHDFDPKSPGADQAVLRLFNYMVKTPEFQLL
jgi:uncharacterized protein (DUF1800 family)